MAQPPWSPKPPTLQRGKQIIHKSNQKNQGGPLARMDWSCKQWGYMGHWQIHEGTQQTTDDNEYQHSKNQTEPLWPPTIRRLSSWPTPSSHWRGPSGNTNINSPRPTLPQQDNPSSLPLHLKELPTHWQKLIPTKCQDLWVSPTPY